MDIVVFGTGQVGREIMPILEKEHNICYYVDNDERKWGAMIGNYLIKSPRELMSYEGSIVVASTQYSMEILKQLLGMEINAERICFCHQFLADNLELKIYPVLAERYQSLKVPLVQYDLFGKEEERTGGKKVLLACLFYSVYTKQVIENLTKRYGDIEFSLLTQSKEYQANIVPGQLEHIYYFQSLTELKTIIEQLPVYDAMQFLWIEFEWAYFYRILRAKTRRLNLNVGGSDFYRVKKNGREFKRPFIACADRITAETKETVLQFEEYYRADLKSPIGLLPFGIEVLDYIDKYRDVPKERIREKFGLPSDRIVVTCGHNALEAHQHIRIIEALSRLLEAARQRAVFVFPMTYPEDTTGYIEEVKNRLESTGLAYAVLTDFMDFRSMAEYALISDVMVHVQITDQLSSTMLEEMYAESIVIAGSWLPYGSLHEMGIYFLDADEISDITKILEDVVLNIESHKQKCKGNSQIVGSHSSWDMLAPEWHALWE